MVANGQGGLLDVALDPAFAENGLVYLSYSEPGDGGAGTAVARGKLGDGSLDDVEVIFRQKPKVDGGNHFGSRLAFSPDGKLFVTLGDRFKFDPAQDLASHIGKIVRINPDGSVPDDNPFVGQEGKLPEIWSYRSPQCARRRNSPGDRQTLGDRVRPGSEATSSTSRKRARITAGRW